MVVNGFMIRSPFFHNVLNIAYLFPVVLHSSKKYITGVDNRKYVTQTLRSCILLRTVLSQKAAKTNYTVTKTWQKVSESVENMLSGRNYRILKNH